MPPSPLLLHRPQHSSSLSSLVDFIHPRKSRLRATFICLFSLVVLTSYIFLVAQPSLVTAPIPILQHPPPEEPRSSWRNLATKYRNAAVAVVVARPEITLTSPQELGAITSFMAALPQNVVPLTIDPTRPIDPQLILDFDTRSAQAETEVEEVVSDVWARNPVVLFSKLHSPISRELKTILHDMKLRPPPTIFEVDQRADAQVLVPMLFRLTNATDLPILLVGGVSVGTIDDIRELDARGQLKTLVSRAGAVIDGGKKTKKGRR
ncbi:hypothetical protein BV25DRAFT_1867714 [Artomyces pyxidatus]|uniref:Uncharacterized protein n=1 Tax=Artomyces pyxidatus TaxID=48021 RepID=A0ACB8TFH7_9AGAM|nr:hypothetical protein BV25DRAFT_1867714 [Artomyces pyxidatus]